MYTANNLGLHYTGEFIFRNINFMINPKDRIGLVGKNGSGKSTLLKIFASELKASEGSISIPKDAEIGYLPQEMDIENTHSIRDEVAKAFSHTNQIQNKIEKLTKELGEREDYESKEYAEIIEQLNKLNERFDLLSGSQQEGELEKVMLGLGFNREQLDDQTSTLSGGWRMRVELAKILLKNPDLLLLDEPTNHLDIESVRWFERFLKTFSGAVMLVSHDRSFLDAVTKRTIEINLGSIKDYKYSYSKFVEIRKEEQEQRSATIANQQKQIQEIERFIERFRYKANKAKQVQSRVKMLEKMDVVEQEEQDNAKMHFSFPPAPRSGKVVLDVKNYAKAYGDNQVLENIDFHLLRNDFVAFVGKNGEGKSTFVKSIVGDINFDGEIKIGHNVEIGYYAQNQEDLLDPEKSVFQTIDDIATGDMRKKVRDLLGSFLFTEEDIDKKVKVLSGGERSRLAIASLLLKPINLLIMDEPTNHLDMQSKDILKHALLNYSGTLILISHDRDFLNALSDKTYEFKNQKIKEHLGDINEFLRAKEIEDIKEIERQKKEKAKAKSTSDNKIRFEQRKQLERDKRKLEKASQKAEEDIDKTESAIEELEAKLANPDKEDFNYADLYKEHEELKNKLEKLMHKWEESHTQAEELNEKIEELK